VSNPYLGREGAPFGRKVWDFLDATLVEIAKAQLSGRKILPLQGPFGLGLVSVPAGVTSSSGMCAVQSIPLTLIEKTFHCDKLNLAQFEREGIMLNTAPLKEAVLECCRLEDTLVFQGKDERTGLLTSPHSLRYTLQSWETVGNASLDIINAVTLLDEAGFHGPYTLALAPSRYNLLLRRYPSGVGTELEHLQQIVQDRIVKAPILQKEGVLLEANAAYASLVLGQDMSLGFLGMDEEGLLFSVSETITLVIHEPQSICILE